MTNRVNGKDRHKKTNEEWKEFIDGLRFRLALHEQKANQLRPLIADLEHLRDEGVPLSVARKKVA
jgi:hypothetical protein